MIIIYKKILSEIKPSDEERNKLLSFSDELMKIILDYASENDVDVECKLVGSVAKKTCLKDKADIDIFMAFPLDYPEDMLKSYGLEFGEYCINKVGGKSEKRYASHPYITGLINEYEIDFVPCYKIKDASELKSAVDRTILHTNYVQSHITDDEADEVLLLKKFMSCVNTYGANYMVSGFSGYLCELLILKYHTFENVLEAAAYKWCNSFSFDLEGYGTSDNYDDPMIAIDPVDANRNVAAALSLQKYSEFIVASRNYLTNPSEAYFNKRSLDIDGNTLIEKFEERETECFVVSFNVPQLPTDIIYPQINKTMNSLIRVSHMYDFRVIKSRYYIQDDVAHIILEYEIATLPTVKIHRGPMVKDRINGYKFKNKYPDAFIDGKKWVSISKRKYRDIKSMIDNLFKKENMSMLKLGKNVKYEILNGYSIERISEFIKKADKKEYEEIYLHLNPNFNIER